MTELAFLSPSGPEWLILAVFALVVLGPQRLPEFARSIGKGLAEARASFNDATTFDSDDEPDPDAEFDELPDYPDDEDEEKPEVDPARAPELPEAG